MGPQTPRVQGGRETPLRAAAVRSPAMILSRSVPALRMDALTCVNTFSPVIVKYNGLLDTFV